MNMKTPATGKIRKRYWIRSVMLGS
jgi:hypothetical protein